MDDPLLTDLKLDFRADGTVDLACDGEDLATVSGVDNLAQALWLRLMVDRGQLAALGHPRYGSRLRDSIGRRMNSAELQLLRRLVRQTLAEDPRVAEVSSVQVAEDPKIPGAVQINAVVRAVGGSQIQIDTVLNVQ